MPIPFHCGTQYADWTSANCDRCKRSDVNGGECDLEIDLGRAYIANGEISKDVAQRIGYYDHKGEYNWPCNEVEWCEWWKEEVIQRQKKAN